MSTPKRPYACTCVYVYIYIIKKKKRKLQASRINDYFQRNKCVCSRKKERDLTIGQVHSALREVARVRKSKTKRVTTVERIDDISSIQYVRPTDMLSLG